jgi:hypothetical protein
LLSRSTNPYPESQLSAKTRTAKVAGVREEKEEEEEKEGEEEEEEEEEKD